jgi:hypothetical protein
MIYMIDKFKTFSINNVNQISGVVQFNLVLLYVWMEPYTILNLLYFI